jgi:hypothetical protein
LISKRYERRSADMPINELPVATAKQKEVFVGLGVLQWSASERRSDRYGAVHLLEYDTGGSYNFSSLSVCPEDFGKRATLYCVVMEIRESTHIGDLFHGVFPSTPAIGDRIILGTGLLFAENDRDERGKPFVRVGVRPFDDDRGTLWMNIEALYRCHSQTVRLMYEPLEDELAAARAEGSNW